MNVKADQSHSAYGIKSSFGMMITYRLILKYANDDDPKTENKKVEFSGKIQFLRYDVTK
jgi:hypothetical protein